MQTAPNKYTACLLGCGKMGGAMLRSWVSDDLFDKMFVVDPYPIDNDLQNISCVEYSSSFPIEHAADIDVLILAVKPQVLKDSVQGLIEKLAPSTLILSIAAGQSIATLSSILGDDRPIIRAMPNTPAAIGKSMSVAVASACVSAQHKERGHSLLDYIGHVEWIEDESLMDAVTAVSGSGPAYVFYLIEALAYAGEAAGLSPDISMQLARQTVIGSAALAEHDFDVPAATLRENVTSPGGTTQAALDVLMDGVFKEKLSEAIGAAKARSIALNK